MRAAEQLLPPRTDPDWLYELKFDGWRCIAGVDHGAAQLRTKTLRDCTRSYPEVAAALASIQGGPHIIDGELTVLDENGVSDFNTFHKWRGGRTKIPAAAPRVTFAAFDLLMCNGDDVMGLPLEHRKVLLQLLLLDAGLEPLDVGDTLAQQLRLELGARRPPVLFVPDLQAKTEIFHALVAAGLPIEGVVAKRRDSRYLPGVQSDAWRKIKRPGWREGRVWTSG